MAEDGREVTVLVITEDWGSEALQEGGREEGRRRE